MTTEESPTAKPSTSSLALSNAAGVAIANRPRSKVAARVGALVEWFRHHGFRATLRQLWEMLVPFEWQAWHWTGCEAGELPPGLALGTDLAELKRLRANLREAAHDFFLDEIDGCRTCVWATVDGELASITWVHDYRQVGPFLRLEKGQIELNSLHTLPKFRGRRLGQYILRNMCVTLANSGVDGIYSTVNGRNKASQKVVQASGWTRVAQWKRPALFGPRYDTRRQRVESWGDAIRHLFW
jgi:ribosomal protein S18 acetylase RimI-like enzyme